MCTTSPPVGLTVRADATPRDTRRTALLRAARARIDDVGGGARDTEVRSSWATSTCGLPDVDVGAACALERRLVARGKRRGKVMSEFANVPDGACHGFSRDFVCHVPAQDEGETLKMVSTMHRSRVTAKSGGSGTSQAQRTQLYSGTQGDAPLGSQSAWANF